MTVVDDGRGFDPDKVETDSLGIISMRERLRQVGGELRILSRRPYDWSVLHVSKG
jgi:signal transduction histidine kinase